MWPVAASVASGVALAFAFPPHERPWLAWLALVPLWRVAVRRGPGGAAALGWVGAATFALLATSWIRPLLLAHAPLTPWQVTATHVAMAAILGMPGAVVAFVLRLNVTRPAGVVLWPAVAWAALEVGRTWHPLGFPWTLLGFTQAGSAASWAVRIVDVPGLSGLLVAGSVALAFPGRRGGRLAAVTAGIAAVALAGWLQPRAAPTAILRVGIVDGAVREQHKWQPGYALRSLERHARLTRRLRDGAPHLVVWPETAVTVFLQDPSDAERRARGAIAAVRTPALVGAPAWTAPAQGGIEQRNRVYLLGPSGATVAWADKQVLVPFGEYVPTAWLRRVVRPLAPQAAPLTPGPPAAPFDVGGVRVAALVCYEHLFPHLARAARRAGARLLINVTNDAWFADGVPAAQQIAQLRLRARAEGVPIIRVANRGPAVAIGADGSVLWRRDVSGPHGTVVAVPVP